MEINCFTPKIRVFQFLIVNLTELIINSKSEKWNSIYWMNRKWSDCLFTYQRRIRGEYCFPFRADVVHHQTALGIQIDDLAVRNPRLVRQRPVSSLLEYVFEFETLVFDFIIQICSGCHGRRRGNVSLLICINLAGTLAVHFGALLSMFSWERHAMFATVQQCRLAFYYSRNSIPGIVFLSH